MPTQIALSNRLTSSRYWNKVKKILQEIAKARTLHLENTAAKKGQRGERPIRDLPRLSDTERVNQRVGLWGTVGPWLPLRAS